MGPQFLIKSLGFGVFSIEESTGETGETSNPGRDAFLRAAESFGIRVSDMSGGSPARTFVAGSEGSEPCTMELAQADEMTEELSVRPPKATRSSKGERR